MNKASDTPTERDEGLRLLINRGAEIAGGAAGPAAGAVIGSLPRIHRFIQVDGVRTAEGCEGVTGAIIRA